MFSLIRGIIIVGLIFYFSPERDISEPEWQRRGERAPDATAPPALVEDGNTQDGLWNRIVGSLAEEAVRTTVNGKAQEAGLRLKEASLSLEPSAKSASADAVRSADRDAEGQASPGQSVRCVYRCDGAE
jgi:hypothetical protein